MKKNSSPPLSLYGQLLWREFFYAAATNNPRFDKMEGNPICVRIPWDRNMEALAKWAEAKTGFPWIDAIMSQLRQEGWIHHLARHAVACFLTRGDLWISWEEGMKVRRPLQRGRRRWKEGMKVKRRRKRSCLLFFLLFLPLLLLYLLLLLLLPSFSSSSLRPLFVFLPLPSPLCFPVPPPLRPHFLRPYSTSSTCSFAASSSSCCS